MTGPTPLHRPSNETEEQFLERLLRYLSGGSRLPKIHTLTITYTPDEETWARQLEWQADQRAGRVGDDW